LIVIIEAWEFQFNDRLFEEAFRTETGILFDGFRWKYRDIDRSESAFWRGECQTG